MTGNPLYLQRLVSELQMMSKPVALMEVCGTHTMAIAKSGIRELVPTHLKLLSGPGCPVCVTAQGDIDAVIWLAQQARITLATFGDMMRVPGTNSSLQAERSRGADIRVVYSPLDALALAQQYPDREIVFLGIGFETTAPAVGATIQQAADLGLGNFSVFSLHKVVPPALEVIFADPDMRIDGLICPGHVAAVTGIQPFRDLAAKYRKPMVVTGFQTQDILEGMVMLLRQLAADESRAELQYRRVVRPEGNRVAQSILQEVFTPADARWRGLGIIPDSGLAIGMQYCAWDARDKFEVPYLEDQPIKGCACGEVLTGRLNPCDCPLFGRGCTPVQPVGPCMVSQEGACAAYYRYTPVKGSN